MTSVLLSSLSVEAAALSTPRATHCLDGEPIARPSTRARWTLSSLISRSDNGGIDDGKPIQASKVGPKLQAIGFSQWACLGSHAGTICPCNLVMDQGGIDIWNKAAVVLHACLTLRSRGRYLDVKMVRLGENRDVYNITKARQRDQHKETRLPKEGVQSHDRIGPLLRTPRQITRQPALSLFWPSRRAWERWS